MTKLHPISKDFLFSKNDAADPRMGDLSTVANIENIQNGDFVILGYPDDEGIKLNNGRVGASEAPDQIRKNFYKLTPGLISKNKPNVKDLGNISGGTITDRHTFAQETAAAILAKDANMIALGGGHDYGYPDGAAFLKHANNPLVINFDAHLDVRPFQKDPHSGTPFYRLLNEGVKFDFLEVGIQSHCNSKDHLAWAREKGAKVLTWDEVLLSGEDTTVAVLRFLEPFILKRRDTYLSVDIDGFSSNYAMGCSAPSPLGFDPASFFRIFRVLCDRLNVRMLGIYEVSPPLDFDHLTSKLAAQIVHRRIFD